MRTPRTTAADWGTSTVLGSAAARGALVSASTTWIRFGVQLVTMVVVARIIGPGQYGAAAMALVAVTAAELVRSGGITWLIARFPDLSAASTATLHRLSVGIGVAVAVALLVVGVLVPVAQLPAGAFTFPLLALVFVAAGIGAVPTALLGRNLAFRPIGTAEVTAAVVSCVVSIVVALGGAGSAALLVQAGTYALVLVVAVVTVTPWRPGRPAPLRSLRTELGFAANATVSQGLEWVVRSFDRLVVAALFGTAAAGFYVQAAQLVTLPTEQVNGPLRRVAVPALGRLLGTPSFRTAFHAVLTLSCTVLWPVLAVLAVLAQPLVASVFGAAWLPTVPVFVSMLPMGLASVVIGVTTFVALAAGTAGRQTIWECAVSRPLTLVGFFVGSLWGVSGVALGASAATVALVVPGFLVIGSKAGLTLRDLVVPLVEPAIGTVACVLSSLATVALVDGPAPLELLLGGGVAAAVWAATFLALPGTRRIGRRTLRAARRRSSRPAHETPATSAA
ncbi:oligosaccharide flippase family protein [Curtobacterium sp. L1-20]|uniref:oligosaccharide flippase family protein n=1 Tax=Curtobacterium sp. L1-20 TaxID=3138181 RepID=UPI003B5295ED